MPINKVMSMLTAVVIALTSLTTGCSNGDTSDQSGSLSSGESADSGQTVISDAEGNDLTSLEVIRLMGNGINLGNTLEAYNHGSYIAGGDPLYFEMGWGQPMTTAEMIKGMKDAGFDTLRIPVAWTNGMNYESGDYTIDERLMSRVEEVVNFALDADMYVIVNDHWDGSWWGMFGSADESVRAKGLEMYKSMWTQIGNRFKDYSYKLIFESANEELGDRLNDSDVTGSKGVLTKDECYETTNMINSEFVKLIRSLGGNNSDRFLLIAGYNTDITHTCDERYKMPEDTAENKLLLSVHYYTPWDYCGTDGVNSWGSPSDYDEQNGLFKDLSKFSEQGYGVVIGEYAVMGTKDTKLDRDKFYNNLLDNCDLYDFCPLLWDCSDFYDRRNLKTTNDVLAEIFSSRRYENEKAKTTEQVKAAAKESIDASYKAAEEAFNADTDIPASDDKAVAWIMFQSADYSKAYSVGDKYDPSNRTTGLKAANAEITGEGQYTISLDFTGCGAAKGTAFAALGISNGETLFPGYTVTIDSILINGEPYEPVAKEYTGSDDGKCTRVNLYNGWVSSVPEDGRTADGSLEGCSAQIMPLTERDIIDTISITFTYSAPKE